MLRFTADPRDGGTGTLTTSLCDTDCCCEQFYMRPGEVNRVEINYAPWSVPIGGPGLVPTLTHTVTEDATACNTSEVNGFVPPAATSQAMVAVGGAATTLDLNTAVLPVRGDYTFAIDQRIHAQHGNVDIAGSVVTYTPNNANINATDVFWFRVTDPDGRYDLRPVLVLVGDTTGLPIPNELTSLVPYVDHARIVTNNRLHTVTFPIRMPLNAQPCHVYKLEIVQTTQDCDGTYTHYSCYDIRAQRC